MLRPRLSSYDTFVLFLTTVFVSIALAGPVRLYEWDEAVYIGVGKWLYSLGSIGLEERIRPLGLPLLLGAMWKAGLPLDVYARLLSILFSAGNIVLTYMIAKKVFGERAGVLASLLIASSSIFIPQSYMLLAEIPSTFFALMSVLQFTRNRMLASGFFGSLAFLFKFTNIIFPAVVLLVFLHRRLGVKPRDAALFAAGFAPLAIAFLAFNSLVYGSAIEPLILASSHQNNLAYAVQGLAANLGYYPTALMLGSPLLLLAVPGALSSFKKADKNRMVVVAYVVVYLAYFTYIANKQGRFALTFMPPIAMLAGFGAQRILSRLKRGDAVFSVAVSFLVLAMMVNLHTTYGWESGPADLGPFGYASDGDIILTTDPRFAPYVDAKIIPFFFSTADKNRIEYMAGNIDALGVTLVAFSPQSFWCAPDDGVCLSWLENTTARIAELDATVPQVYNGTYIGQTFHVYRLNG